jgi:hypothetical protein
MGSKAKVNSHVTAALQARAVEDKLNAIARAISELADFVDDLENQLRGIEQKVR